MACNCDYDLLSSFLISVLQHRKCWELLPFYFCMIIKSIQNPHGNTSTMLSRSCSSTIIAACSYKFMPIIYANQREIFMWTQHSVESPWVAFTYSLSSLLRTACDKLLIPFTHFSALPLHINFFHVIIKPSPHYFWILQRNLHVKRNITNKAVPSPVKQFNNSTPPPLWSNSISGVYTSTNGRCERLI